VFWLFALSAVSYLDRVNISIAGGSIVDAYHLIDVQLGEVFSAFVAGYALFQTLSGDLADRFGPRRVLTSGVAWWGIFTALTALVPADIGGALYFSQSSFWSVTADIAGASAGSLSGFMNMGGQMGGALTSSLTPWIAARYGGTPSFLVAAGLCLLGAISWLAVDPLRPLSQTQTVEALDQVHT